MYLFIVPIFFRLWVNCSKCVSDLFKNPDKFLPVDNNGDHLKHCEWLLCGFQQYNFVLKYHQRRIFHGNKMNLVQSSIPQKLLKDLPQYFFALFHTYSYACFAAL